jgi:benzil reductase ((S)-benzoin forming)
MNPDLTILTGASRGLGAALAEQLLQPGATLVAIARSAMPELEALALERGATLEAWSLDLADAPAAASRLADWLRAQDGERFDSATLINNAALLTTIAPLEDAEFAEHSRALRVGLEAPLLLSAAFLAATRGWHARREGRCKLLNISSGLGRFAMASQANYCAVKAGLDHFTRAVALDQAQAKHPARAVSLAPGVIDTDMQTHLRGSAAERFPDRERFVNLKSSGQLDSPGAAAAKVLAYLQRSDFGDKPVADVRDA